LLRQYQVNAARPCCPTLAARRFSSSFQTKFLQNLLADRLRLESDRARILYQTGGRPRTGPRVTRGKACKQQGCVPSKLFSNDDHVAHLANPAIHYPARRSQASGSVNNRCLVRWIGPMHVPPTRAGRFSLGPTLWLVGIDQRHRAQARSTKPFLPRRSDSSALTRSAGSEGAAWWIMGDDRDRDHES